MENIRGFKKYILKAIKLFIILLSNFGRNQKIIYNLLIWINIQQGKNAPLNNDMEVDFVSRFLDLDKELLLIDVGGHQGSYTDELLKNFSNAKIILFEPSKSKYEILVEKYKENKKVSIENFAISNFSGKGKLYLNNNADSLATLYKREEKNRDRYFALEEDIEIIKFSDFWSAELNFQRIDLIKLDIEGSEFNVIKDLENNLSKINLIQFEFGEANIGSRIFFKDFWNIFNLNNFTIFRYTHKRNLIKVKNYTEYDEFFRYTNYLAVNNKLIN